MRVRERERKREREREKINLTLPIFGFFKCSTTRKGDRRPNWDQLRTAVTETNSHRRRRRFPRRCRRRRRRRHRHRHISPLCSSKPFSTKNFFRNKTEIMNIWTQNFCANFPSKVEGIVEFFCVPNLI